MSEQNVLQQRTKTALNKRFSGSYNKGYRRKNKLKMFRQKVKDQNRAVKVLHSLEEVSKLIPSKKVQQSCPTFENENFIDPSSKSYDNVFEDSC